MNAWCRAGLALCLIVPAAGWGCAPRSPSAAAQPPAPPKAAEAEYQPRPKSETGGLATVADSIPPWPEDASLAEVARRWKGAGYRHAKELDRMLQAPHLSDPGKVEILLDQARCFLFEGDPGRAYQSLTRARTLAERDPALAKEALYSVIYLQGLSGLRLGETENCVRCRGMSACIIPLDPAAIHRQQRGSQLAVRHFTEYLERFPDDLGVKWLLNVACMTLGKYPRGLDQKYFVPLDRFAHSELDIGRFEDIGYKVGLDRENEAGGAVMDDFDNDGLLDVVLSSMDPTQSLGVFKNTGDGHFREVSASAGVSGELGGLNLVQGDYNNDGWLDLYIPRAAWLLHPIQPSLLRNNGDGTFTNVTRQAGLAKAVMSNAAQWADYDNDGYLDLLVCCEHTPNRLYHNRGDGTFEEVAQQAGLLGTKENFCKGASWLDYDGDDYPDLFANYLDGTAHLFRNDGRGRFADVSAAMGVDGPPAGFSCWAFDYDNDGWPDLFATCYQRTTAAVVNGLVGQPNPLENNRLFHNEQGKRFTDATRAAGLDMCFATMGSNFGDLDNDGFLDFYLGTGEPDLATIVPNRLFKNVDGRRFAEITGSSHTGHLQKGHGVAFGDWDCDGNVDLFEDLGGAVPGDRYHNVLYQNPGHDNQWLTVKLVGKKTNRCAIGARIKVVTAGPTPQTIYRWVCSGSSFGGNPLQQTIGLGKAQKVATLEVHWPTSHTTQTFRDVAVDQAIEVTELADRPRPLNWKRIPVPAASAPAAAP